MNIFDFFKKKRVEVTPEEEYEHQPQKATIPTPPPMPEPAKSEILLSDLIPYDFSTITENDYNGRIFLSNKLFGMFPYLDVEKFSEGKPYNVSFISLSKSFTPELRQFVDRCVATFGPTKFGEANITPTDERHLMIGRFSRMWSGVWLECGPDDENGGLTAIRLTLFDIDQTLNTIMK